ncbi:MAG: hypothetical protein GX589_03970 [Deltaproteobacteria bacterium]|nr:hypothetical protein [Deltaproteobacteria bacterium]
MKSLWFVVAALIGALHAFFSPSAFAQSYCAAKSNYAKRMWIARVQNDQINNISGAGSYQNFSRLNINMARGSTVQLSLTPGAPNPPLGEWKIFVDFNGDFDFNDPGESVFSGTTNGKTTLLARFNVPANAKIGKTRMRIVMRHVGTPTACGTFTYGEVEDYGVTITNITVEPETSFYKVWSLTTQDGIKYTHEYISITMFPYDSTYMRVLTAYTPQGVLIPAERYSLYGDFYDDDSRDIRLAECVNPDNPNGYAKYKSQILRMPDSGGLHSHGSIYHCVGTDPEIGCSYFPLPYAMLVIIFDDLSPRKGEVVPLFATPCDRK